jgi:hypothetical protein
VHGESGEPTHGAPPTDTAQMGHGCVGLPVRTVIELSGKLHVAAPVAVSSVPLGGAENAFVTHNESPAFETGSGVPNGHPTFVQSIPGGGTQTVVDPMSHVVPAQLVAGSGWSPRPGGRCQDLEIPPPIEIGRRGGSSAGSSARSRYVFPRVPRPRSTEVSAPQRRGW